MVHPLLVCDGCRVPSSLCLRICHQSLVLSLSILLVCLTSGHVFVKVSSEQIHHGDDSVMLLTLLLIGTPRLWGGRGGNDVTSAVVGRNLREIGDACACNTSGCHCGSCLATHVDSDPLLPGELDRRRRSVKIWVVELHHPVLRKPDELLRSVVSSHRRLEFGVFCFPILRGFRNRLVQGLHTCNQGSDLRGERGDAVLRSRHTLVQIREAVLQPLQLILCSVQRGLTVGFLVVIVGLFASEQCDHVVDHFQHLVETLPLPCQSKHHQLKSRVFLRIRRLEDLHSSLTHCPRIGFHLKQRRAWQCLFEQLQGIVVIQKSDGLCQGSELLGARLRSRLPFSLLCCTICSQVGKELPVRTKRLGCVIQLLLQVNDVDTDLTQPLRLRLNGLGVCGNLLRLRCHQAVVVLDGTLFGCRAISKILLHGVFHLLQNASDFPTPRCVLLRLFDRQERSQCITIHGAHVHINGELAQLGSCRRLQEASSRTLLECRDGSA